MTRGILYLNFHDIGLNENFSYKYSFAFCAGDENKQHDKQCEVKYIFIKYYDLIFIRPYILEIIENLMSAQEII